MSVRMMAFEIAFAIVVIGCLIARTAGATSLFAGTDGRTSTSKTQAVLWTCAVAFGYLAVFIERWIHGDTSVGLAVPQNLLLAMGFSGTSMVAAKAATTTFVARGIVDKSHSGAPLGGLLTDDSGNPDLGKIQNMAFTFLALAIYLIKLASQGDATTLPTLVDIDATLMVLMGISHASYLGDKLATKGAPTASRKPAL